MILEVNIPESFKVLQYRMIHHTYVHHLAALSLEEIANFILRSAVWQISHEYRLTMCGELSFLFLFFCISFFFLVLSAFFLPTRWSYFQISLSERTSIHFECFHKCFLSFKLQMSKSATPAWILVHWKENRSTIIPAYSISPHSLKCASSSF